MNEECNAGLDRDTEWVKSFEDGINVTKEYEKVTMNQKGKFLMCCSIKGSF